MKWSAYQQDIFDAVENEKGSLIVEAVAGSGKTTTIVEAINHVPQHLSVAFLAFNKAIADELKRRISAPNARCMTLHSAGFTAWRRHLGSDARACQTNSRKSHEIVDEFFTKAEIGLYGREISKLVGIAKGQGLVPKGLEDPEEGTFFGLIDDDDEVWKSMIEFYGLDEDGCNIRLGRFVLSESIKQSREVIDFDDMLYMPVIAGAPFDKYDVVFLDEAQDVNGLQIEIVKRLCHDQSRVIAVGDPRQAIYGWRGALSNSMGQIAAEFKCRSLPLSVSYRCPQTVVAHAREFVKHILPHDAAPQGLVETPLKWSLADFQPSDAILCRINRPLIETAFLFIRNKIPCRVLGRDIGKNLVAIVKKMKARSLEDLEYKLEDYRQREYMKAKGDEGKMAAVDDKLATLEVFMAEFEHNPNATVDMLIGSIDSLFSDDGMSRSMLTLATVHKSKGLEFERVFILDAADYMPSKWARQPWQREQEINLIYVAVTRAKMELRYISSEILRLAENRVLNAVPTVTVENGEV